MTTELAGGRTDRRRQLGWRIEFCFALLLLAFGGLGARLYLIQCRDAEALQRSAQEQSRFRRAIPALRGPIFDTRFRCLARSVPSESVGAWLPDLGDPAAAARALAPLLGEPEGALAARLAEAAAADRRWVYLARRVDTDVAEQIRALKLPGVALEADARRCYPLGRAASHVVGLVGPVVERPGRPLSAERQAGLEGLELVHDALLRGRNGWELLLRDGRGRSLMTEDLPRSPPVPGRGLVLTLDACLQEIAVQELAKAVAEYRPKGAWALMMDPRDGGILALASWPDYDPLDRTGLDPEMLRARPITDSFEPGSIFKPFVIAAARQTGAVSWTENFDCENGAWKINGRTVRDAHPYGVLSCRDGLVKSSNIWASKVGLRLGPERLDRALRAFGFGRLTGLDFPGETAGILRPRSEWSGYSQVSLSFGQEVATTPLQLVTGYSALINGGLLLRPRLVRGVTDGEGRLIEEYPPEVVARVLAPEISAELREVLAEVVERGTGRRARLAEYALGGKTGTAQKAVPGGYSPDRYIGSFVGFGPAENPRLMLVVSLDEPQGAYYGGLVAAPTAAEILRRSLIQLNVPRRTEGRGALAARER